MERLNLAIIQTQQFLANLDRPKNPAARDERGAINTIEILLIIAVVIIIVAVLSTGLTSYVRSHMPK